MRYRTILMQPSGDAKALLDTTLYMPVPLLAWAMRLLDGRQVKLRAASISAEAAPWGTATKYFLWMQCRDYLADYAPLVREELHHWKKSGIHQDLLDRSRDANVRLLTRIASSAFCLCLTLQLLLCIGCHDMHAHMHSWPVSSA